MQVTVIGFGGIPSITLSRSEAERVVQCALERGINYFDTARAYGGAEGLEGQSNLSDQGSLTKDQRGCCQAWSQTES